MESYCYNIGLESELHRLQSQEAQSNKKDLDSVYDEKTSVKIKDLEKMLRHVKSEKDELHRDVVEAQEKLKLQSKELKDALGQRKLAMAEYSEVSDKLSELRSHKQKLSRQVRDKEEELDTAMQKIDNFRQDLRKADKLRRELEARVEEAQAEAMKERRLRERSEEYAHHLEEEMESMKQRHVGRVGTPSQVEANQEINRLRGELETLDAQHKETLAQIQTRHTSEISNLREQIQEMENIQENLEREIIALKDKLEEARSESTLDYQEMMNEIKRSHDREKELMQDENRKLGQEIDRVKLIFGFCIPKWLSSIVC